MRMDVPLKDARFMTAAAKRRVLKQWAAFLEGGLDPRLFAKGLYEHLIQHCSFIAHYDRGGFIDVYFEDPSATQRFLDQFDRSKGCPSVEYGGAGWIDGEECGDINGAMADAATALLPGLRRALRERETAMARRELERAQERLAGLLADREAGAAPHSKED